MLRIRCYHLIHIITITIIIKQMTNKDINLIKIKIINKTSLVCKHIIKRLFYHHLAMFVRDVVKKDI
jgi:hypothetical protein